MQVRSQQFDGETPGRQNLIDEITAFTDKANDAAITLFTISSICHSVLQSAQSQREVASKLMAVSGALTSFRVLLCSTSYKPVLREHDLRHLSQSIQSCEPALQTIMKSTRILNEFLVHCPIPKGSKVPGVFNMFNKSEEVASLSMLDNCFHRVMRSIMIARADQLSQHETLATDESSELLRLQRALANNDMSPPTATMNSPFATNHTGSQGTNTFGTFQRATRPAAPHMEAYMLSVNVNSMPNSSVMSYRIESLALGEGNVKAHMDKHCQGDSLIKAISELLPSQVEMIQSRAKDRKGEIVSVQFGGTMHLATRMGAVKVRTVIFVIQTAEDKAKENTNLFGHPTFSMPAAFNPRGGQTTTCGLFGRGAKPSGHSVFAAQPSGPDPFASVPQPAQPSGPLFGAPAPSPLGPRQPWASAAPQRDTRGPFLAQQSTSFFLFPSLAKPAAVSAPSPSNDTSPCTGTAKQCFAPAPTPKKQDDEAKETASEVKDEDFDDCRLSGREVSG
ncbi:hypothetical protein ACEQ8H_006089 [Pleosporales sp. CAS-2024a]